MYVEVYVDPADCMRELSSDQLRDELKRRGDMVPDLFEDFTTDQLKEEIRVRGCDSFFEEDRETFEEVLAALRAGNAAEAEYILERTLFPKFPSIEFANSMYAAARRA